MADQAANEAFVEPPLGADRYRALVARLEHGPRSLDRPLEHRGVDNVKLDAVLGNRHARRSCLFHSSVGQGRIHPGNESSLPVPHALAVPHEHDLVW